MISARRACQADTRPVLLMVVLTTTLFQCGISVHCYAGYYDYSGYCEICPVNTYKDAWNEATSCTPCPANSNTNGLTGRKEISACKCAAGYTGSISTGCIACPVNTYMKAGTNQATSCTACPANSNTIGLTGRKAITDCLCEPGYTFSSSTGCTACPVGTYKSSTGNGGCASCPGKSNTNGLTGRTDRSACQCDAGFFGFSNDSSLACTRCPAGTYKSEAGNGEASKVCLTCGVDTYSEAGSTSCRLCPVSTSTNNETKQTSCNFCNKGYYGTPTTQGGCTTCPAGTYKPTVGNGLESDVCVPCPVNTFSATAGTSTCTMACPPHSTTNNQTGQTSCLCDIGYYGDGKTICQKCPPGTKKNSIGNGELKEVCQACDVNTYSFGGSAACNVCPVNSNTLTQTGQGRCQCNPGYYGDGINACSACLAGTSKSYHGNGNYDEVCLPCNKDTFSSSNGSTICTPCTPHSTTLGSSGQTTCVCAAGYYGNGKICESCPAGTYKALPGNGDMVSVCLACPVNTFAQSAGQTGCVTCSSGFTTFGKLRQTACEQPTEQTSQSSELVIGLSCAGAGVAAMGGIFLFIQRRKLRTRAADEEKIKQIALKNALQRYQSSLNDVLGSGFKIDNSASAARQGMDDFESFSPTTMGITPPARGKTRFNLLGKTLVDHTIGLHFTCEPGTFAATLAATETETENELANVTETSTFVPVTSLNFTVQNRAPSA